MSMKRHVLVIDAGSSSVRSLIVEDSGIIIGEGRSPISWKHRHPGWAELDPVALWKATRQTILDAVLDAGIPITTIAAAGITSHRETIMIWDRTTGEPVHDALVWISNQTDDIIERWNSQGLAEEFTGRTGLRNDSFFSAGKIAWLLENVDGLRRKISSGNFIAGTVDTWLSWNLNGRTIHATDPSCASRTALFNIHTLRWDNELLGMLDIPEIIFPQLIDSDGDFGKIDRSILDADIPIRAVVADQQSGMFGQACFTENSIKNTFGTAGVLTVNVGNAPQAVEGLTGSVAWKVKGDLKYEIEGVVFHSGQTIQWLRDNLGVYAPANRIDDIVKSVSNNGGVYLVPALGGLAAPYWDRKARASIQGLSLDTTSAHLVRAAVEAMAFQTLDIIEKLSELKVESIKVDGGGAGSNFLCQFLADISGLRVLRPFELERTALGTAYVAGLGVGIWSNLEEINNNWSAERIFEPVIKDSEREKVISEWKTAVQKTLTGGGKK
jgi:glycerol kinase